MFSTIRMKINPIYLQNIMLVTSLLLQKITSCQTQVKQFASITLSTTNITESTEHTTFTHIVL